MNLDNHNGVHIYKSNISSDINNQPNSSKKLRANDKLNFLIEDTLNSFDSGNIDNDSD